MQLEREPCYVCLDGTPPLYRTCACSRLVHRECYERVVATVPSHRTHCPVCMLPHPGETVREGLWRWHLDIPFLVAADFNAILCGLFLAWVMIIRNVHPVVTFARLLAVFMCLITVPWTLYLHARVFVERRRLCGISVKWMVEERTALSLPDPEEEATSALPG